MTVTSIDTSPNRLVAVYGTLKKDYGRYPSLQPIADKGPWWLKDHVMKHVGYYPAVIPFEGYDSLCEVYEVPAERMIALDAIEGVSSDLYRRKQVDTPWGKAEIYYQPESRLRNGDDIIPSGVWLGVSTYTQKWHGDAHEAALLKRSVSPSRVLSLRNMDGKLDVMTMQALRKQAALPAQNPAPAVHYLPPPAPAPKYPIIDLAAVIGPGLEEG